MNSRMKILAILSAPFLLSGCGEGYELVKVTSFPYNNQRTAGSGYAYVLAKMMPAKTVVLDNVRDVKRDWKPNAIKVVPKTQPIKSAEPVFRDAVKK